MIYISYHCIDEIQVDLGPCPNVHDEELKKKYQHTETSGRKVSAEDDFIRYLVISSII